MKDYQTNDGPIEKIDSMDYEHVSLDTIAKLPSTLRAAMHESKPGKPVQEADVELMKSLFKDELFESDQIQYMNRRKKNANVSESLNNETLNQMLLVDFDDHPILHFNEEAEHSQRELNSNLTHIFMDLGPASRELAPQKLQGSSKAGMKSKTLLKVKINSQIQSTS